MLSCPDHPPPAEAAEACPRNRKSSLAPSPLPSFKHSCFLFTNQAHAVCPFQLQTGARLSPGRIRGRVRNSPITFPLATSQHHLGNTFTDMLTLDLFSSVRRRLRAASVLLRLCPAHHRCVPAPCSPSLDHRPSSLFCRPTRPLRLLRIRCSFRAFPSLGYDYCYYWSFGNLWLCKNGCLANRLACLGWEYQRTPRALEESYRLIQ